MHRFEILLRTTFQLFFACILVSGKNFFPDQVFQDRFLGSSLTASKHSCLVRNVEWMECLLRCTRDGSCVSYNFILSRETCELNAFGLVNDCGETSRLLHSKDTVFQQIRADKNIPQCMAAETCAPDHAQVGQDSCQSPPRTSCNDILKNGQSRGNGVYTIKPVGSSELRVYCDMITDGGGWTLIKRSIILTKPVVVAMTLTSNINSITKYNDLSLILNPTGLKKVKDLLGFKQMRWFCHKQSVGRYVHVMTNDDDAGQKVISYFTENTPPVKACGSFTSLPDDTSKLSQNCGGWGATLNQGEWGRRDRNGIQRIHGFVMVWMEYPDYMFNMLPGEYMCDDADGQKYDVNDVWALYVR